MDFENRKFEGVINIDSAPVDNGESFYRPVQNDINAFVRPRVYNERQHEKKSYKKLVAGLVALTLALNVGVMSAGIMVGKNIGEQSNRDKVSSEIKTATDSPKTEGTQAAPAGNGLILSVPEIAKKAGPSVVGISSVIERMSFFGSSASSGSGIILNKDGYIITNNHVIEGATKITVTFNTGDELEAKLVGRDPRTDLAVIKVDGRDTLVPAELGDSNKLEVGELAVAIGNPLGQEFAGSVTVGVVSALNRTIQIEDKSLNLIQTDAAINAGNSGGALVNTYGQIIGINTAKLSSYGVEGMGFSIPISEAIPIITDLISNGYVVGRPVIGISGRPINEQTAKAQGWVVGVQVMMVAENTGAEIAGLEKGDIITKFNNVAIKNVDELNKEKDKCKAGQVVTLEVFKYSTEKMETVSLKLGEDKPQ